MYKNHINFRCKIHVLDYNNPVISPTTQQNIRTLGRVHSAIYRQNYVATPTAQTHRLTAAKHRAGRCYCLFLCKSKKHRQDV